MLPGIAVAAIGEGIADLVIGYGLAVIGRQQIAPGAVAIAVAGCLCGCAKYTSVMYIVLTLKSYLKFYLQQLRFWD